MKRPSLIALCYIVVVLPVFLLFAGCKKNDPVPQNGIVPQIAQRMVLVYIAANNDLRSEAINSIIQLQLGAKSLNGDLLVFVKTNPLNSYLLRVNYGTGDKIVSDTLKIYGEDNTSDASFLGSVINDARTLSPARTYGLVLWSHATAWVPPADGIGTKSFGWDDGKEMDILDLKAILPDDFEYIMFDACSMASMEVIYELRDKAKYILASPAEILTTGFPYEKITEHLFTDSAGLKYVSELFIDHYKARTGLFSSATVSLIATEELMPIASLTQTLLQTAGDNLAINVGQVQRLDFDDAPVPGYDFLDFLEKHFN